MRSRPSGTAGLPVRTLLIGSRLGAAPILGCGADDAAGVGDEIRQDQYAARGERGLGIGGARDIGTLRHQTCPQPRHVAGMDRIRPCRRDPDVAGDVDDRIARELPPTPMLAQRSAFGFERDQCGDVEPVVGDRPLCVAGTDQDRPLLRYPRSIRLGALQMGKLLRALTAAVLNRYDGSAYRGGVKVTQGY